MRQSPAVSLIIISVFFLILSFPLNSEASLQSGIPFDTYLNAMTYANIDIYVPPGATKLTVTIRNGSGDLDLYLKYGGPVQGDTLGQFNANADVMSAGPTADETIVLTPETTPPLREGAWYVATLNLNNTTTHFTLTATVEVPVGPPPQTLPVPAGQEFWVYPQTETCVANYDAVSSMPICVQTSTSGVKTATIKIETRRFEAPLDIYFGIYVSQIDSKNIYLLTEDYQLKPAAEGVVPWRRGVSGPLSENVFGDLPLSGLPPGRYDFYLLITPSGRTDTFYIWATSYVVKPGPENVADGNAAFFDGTVVIPKAKIQFQGQFYDETAPIPPNTLVGVIKSDKVYLYHTALGTVPLSEQTTRRAIGLFVMDNFGDAPAAAASRYAATSDQLLTYANPVTLKTWVKLTRLAEKVVDASNELHRWAAIKGTDGSGPIFLQPRARYLDNNLLQLFGTKFGPGLGYTGTWFNASNDNEESLFLNSNSLTIETFGATWRPLPYFLQGATDIAGTVASLLFGSPNPVTNIPIDGLALAEEKDPKLVNALNNIDLAAMFFEGAKLFAATFDVTEEIEPLSSLVCNLAMTITHSWVNGEAGTPQAIASARKVIEDLANDLPTALINAGTVGGGTPFFTLVDGIATLDYLIEDVVVHDIDVVGSWAYDEVRIEPETPSTVDLFTYPWSIYRSCDETSTSCSPVPNYLKFYTNQEYDMFSSSDMVNPDSHGTWKLTGSTLTLTPTDSRDCTAYYVGTMIYAPTTKGATIKGYYILGPQCANPGEKKYWMAQ